MVVTEDVSSSVTLTDVRALQPENISDIFVTLDVFSPVKSIDVRDEQP